MIGCFKTPSGLFSVTLGDFTHEADPDQALMQCGELAHNKSYQVFALGFDGLCLSGPDAQDKYYLNKPPAKKNKCSNGIGRGPHSVVYSFGMDDDSFYFTFYTRTCRFLPWFEKRGINFNRQRNSSPNDMVIYIVNPRTTKSYKTREGLAFCQPGEIFEEFEKKVYSVIQYLFLLSLAALTVSLRQFTLPRKPHFDMKVVCLHKIPRCSNFFKSSIPELVFFTSRYHFG